MGPPGALSGRKARIFDSWSPSWAPLGTVLALSWVVLGASWTVLGPSRAVPGQSWGPFGPSSGDIGGLLGRLGGVVGASWTVLERSWGSLGRSWSVGKPKRRDGQKPPKTNWKSMSCASREGLSQRHRQWLSWGHPRAVSEGLLGGLSWTARSPRLPPPSVAAFRLRAADPPGRCPTAESPARRSPRRPPTSLPLRSRRRRGPQGRRRGQRRRRGRRRRRRPHGRKRPGRNSPVGRVGRRRQAFLFL